MDYVYKVQDIKKQYNRECVTVYVNGVQMISFGEEGNLSKNDANADAFIALLKEAWSIFWFEPKKLNKESGE
jgi:hypothetical protein